MKLDKVALLEIMNIVQKGLLEGEDISSMLRELDLTQDPQAVGEDALTLSSEYLVTHPRNSGEV